MKFSAALLALATLGLAAPSIDVLESRQLGQSTRTDLENGRAGNCPAVILIYARASTETGNMGTSVGPALAGSLEREFNNNVWIQGVGSPYSADLLSNVLPAGTSSAAIREATRLYNMANQKCPNTPVVTGGYSQGTAVVFNALGGLGAAAKEQVKGAVLFGYTKNKQNGGVIPNFPADRTKVFCKATDEVCNGSLTITAAHFTYNDDARGSGADFLISRV